MKAKKSLGQNFLNNNQIISDIVGLLNVTADDLILEIGPGRGALTNLLSKKDCNLICVEIDTDMKSYLCKYESDKTSIIYDDILNTDLHKLLTNYKYNKLYIIGNLPYYITSPILELLIDSDINAQEMVFMVQNEVADRFSAKVGTKEYGYMTLYLSYYYDVSKNIFVDRSNFSPIPKVDSAVIKMVKKENIDSIDSKVYFKFLKKAFALKRKTLKNNLSKEEWEQVLPILKRHNFSESVRAEQLSQEIFLELFKAIRKED